MGLLARIFATVVACRLLSVNGDTPIPTGAQKAVSQEVAIDYGVDVVREC